MAFFIILIFEHQILFIFCKAIDFTEKYTDEIYREVCLNLASSGD